MKVINTMRKTWLVSIWIIMLPIILGGCWDIKYLDELSIVIAVGMDQSEDDEIQVTVQVVNPSEVSTGGSKGGGGGQSAATTYSESGRTVFEAIRKIANKTSRRLYFSHTQVLVVGEDLARKGVRPLFEFIERDPEVRTDFYFVVAKGATASDVLQITTPVEKIPGTKIYESIENVEKVLGTSYSVRIKDVIEEIGSEKKEIAAGSIEIIGDLRQGNTNRNVEQINPRAVLKLNGMAVFKDEKLVGFFDTTESRGLSWLEDKMRTTVIGVPCDKGNIAVEVIHSKTHEKVKFQQGMPSIVIDIEQEANLGETLCPDMDISSREALAQFDNELGQQVKKEMLAAVKQAQTWKADVFGFADAVYKANPAYWKQNKSNWDEIFVQIPIQMEVDTKITREGRRNKSYFSKVQKE